MPGDNLFTIDGAKPAKRAPAGKPVEEKPAEAVAKRNIPPQRLFSDVFSEKYTLINQYCAMVKRPEREIVGREDELTKIMAALQRPELCNVMLLAPAGSGKALANGTFIPVADDRGYVEIQNLRCGDFVFDENGEPTEVIGVFPQGKKHAYAVRFKDDTESVCCDEHLWGVRSYWQHKKNGFYTAKSLREIMDFGLISKNGKRPLYQWHVPRNKPLNRPERGFAIDPYVMGALIGDGSLTEPILYISSDDEHVVNRVCKGLGAVGVERNAHNYHWSFLRPDDMDTARSDAKYIQSREIAALGDFSMVFGQKSIDKRIPREYFLGSANQRLELLRGLMDTDGSVISNDRTNCRFSTNSEGLAYDVMELAASLGMRTAFHKVIRNDEIHVNSEYNIHFSIHDDDKESLFSLPRHIQTLRDNRRDDRRGYPRFDDMPIVDVKDLKAELDMTCIQVAAESKLFQAGKEHIVTHNTMLVQGTAMADLSRVYIEIDLAKMIANLNDPNEMAAILKSLFDEAAEFVKNEKQELVLFMDEFHQVVQLSKAAVEALKPILADSGTRGLRVIAATTFVEFREHIMPNQPLVERLQRVNVPEPDKNTTVLILRGMAERYGVADQFYDNHVFELIYDYTNRYIPANSQPRKSIIMLDAMVGWHRAYDKPLGKALLADIIYMSEGINVAFKADASRIKEELDRYVLAQQLASSVIEERLQICVAELNNTGKPMSSFLFTGSTGVGKALPNSVEIPVFDSYLAGGVSYKRNGDVKVGDWVFNRFGVPVEVAGVFDQGECDVYYVHLADGRYLPCNLNHLWGVWTSDDESNRKGLTVYSTETLLNKGVPSFNSTDYKPEFFIPASQGVAWPERSYKISPYIVGAFVGDSILKLEGLFLRKGNRYAVGKASKAMGLKYRDVVGKAKSNGFHWMVPLALSDAENYEDKKNIKDAWDFFDSFSNMSDATLERDRRIPEEYMTGSYDQRWELVRGLFDMQGRIDPETSSLVYRAKHFTLASDVSKLLHSLGIQNELNFPGDYEIWVDPQSCDERRFFTDRLLLEKAEVAYKLPRKLADKRVGIRYIEKQDYRENMTCIYVNDPEHLYQAGNFVVTHNTEMAKQLAKVLFDDDRSLLRFDMTEYALDESLDRFRTELTNRIWEKPYSIVLLDEIEKACAPVTRLLLQVLDDGRLVNANNRETSFKNCYIIITTNAGSEVYAKISQYNTSDTGDGSGIQKYMKLIRESIITTAGDSKFPPELLGRVNAIVPFQPLSEATMKNIVKMNLNKLKATVKEKHNIELKIDDMVIRYLVEDNMDTQSDSGGARAVMGKLESNVTTEVARFINSHKNIRKMGVYVRGELAADNKKKVDSEAYIEVRRIND